MTYRPSEGPAVAPARRIRSHAEAIDAAQALAELWSRSAAEVDRERRVPVAELRALEASGLLGIQVPKRHGGAALPFETLIEVFLILGATDVSLAQVPQNHYDFVDTIQHAGERTQAYFYPRILDGARFGNALAEPWRKSRRDIVTSIVPDGLGYRVNGKKFFSTGALTAHVVPVIAVDPDGRFLVAYVDRDAEGLDVQADWDAFGQRGTFSGTTVLDNVYVEADHVIHRDGANPALLAALFAGSQLIHAAIAAGGATGATRLAARAAPDFIAARGLGERLGVLEARSAAARALVLRAARLIDRSLLELRDEALLVETALAVDEAKSLAYVFGPEVGNELADFVDDGSEPPEAIGRFWRNARVHSLHDPARWRQHFVADYHLNGRLSADVAGRLQALVDLNSSLEPNSDRT
ncbi:SfnB family sulfur acquisition oxidoreductase [Kaistia sp. 32K]|uniref:acyl-CoA dehydrogenase family protein n=1 Tax=Kaistia sp. 32K TaxID=2795690 RepID=UPI0019160BB2|nr:acyl-CoA dehydrogenase family protein [Kaistia sp. 32K]BCP55541.1 SfnB family sulfur acquisition oxidoreductase [Kaistia sp. 32K]